MNLPLRLLLLSACALAAGSAAALAAKPKSALPPIRHVFVVVLENENASSTFGPDSAAPYLSQTLPKKGAFIPEYYGVTTSASATTWR